MPREVLKTCITLMPKARTELRAGLGNVGVGFTSSPASAVALSLSLLPLTTASALAPPIFLPMPEGGNPSEEEIEFDKGCLVVCRFVNLGTKVAVDSQG